MFDNKYLDILLGNLRWKLLKRVGALRILDMLVSVILYTWIRNLDQLMLKTHKQNCQSVLDLRLAFYFKCSSLLHALFHVLMCSRAYMERRQINFCRRCHALTY